MTPARVARIGDYGLASLMRLALEFVKADSRDIDSAADSAIGPRAVVLKRQGSWRDEPDSWRY